jgi:rhodanese-related sulfurtransferase/DNA-binding transcriptional ArsR family regulator
LTVKTTDVANYKNDIYEQFARIGKAISSPKRIELLDLLAQGARTVEVLAKEAGLSVANTSRHLQILREAHLVEAQKEGLFVIYRLGDRAVLDFMKAIRAVAEERLVEVERIARRFLNGSEMEPIDRTELVRRLKERTAIVIDVRPVEEFRAGHIKGAVSVPLRELEDRISELPREKEIVAYCRGRYCLMALQAVEILTAKGYRARRFDESVQDWRALGLPVDAERKE